ncbi:MAG: hypothetical protein IJ572_01775 [Bacilli bacterium]|nr:hypothetical protein [Bacilli bacterium]
MTSSKKQLKIFSWIYFVFAILTAILAVSVYFIPEVTNEAIKAQLTGVDLKNIDPKLVITISFAVAALFNLLFFTLLRRVANGKSKGIIVMFLLLISIAGSIYSITSGYNISKLISLLIDVYIFILVLTVRKK